MDKVMATRLDESVIRRIGLLAKRLRTTKKAVIELAIAAYAGRVEGEATKDVFAHTHGAWRRDESPDETVEHGRRAFGERAWKK